MPRTVSSSTLQELTGDLNTEELIKRLKNCCKSLGEYESLDDVNSSELHSLSEALIQPFLQSHRSREVRALVACCIADIFRVCYPDPPYDESQRRLIFGILINQLQNLEKPSSPAFKYSFQLLETLASIRLFNLCLELEAQDVLTDVFKMLISVINKDQSTKVKNYIIEILSVLVQDGDSLPQEVMDIILSNLLEPRKTENRAVYEFTVDFIRRTSSHIEPYIHLFFNNALMVGRSAESEVADHLYDLILELHAIDSSVLLAVMPQLEFKLKSTETEERFEVTQLLAKMFSPKVSKLATENRPLWNCFLGRFVDVAAHIRVECVRFAKHFLLYHPHLVEDITLKLHDRFYDKEERVRMEVVKSVCEVAAENLEVVPKILREDLEGRMRDKVWAIRKECISNMARIYRQLMSSSFSSGGALNSASVKRLHWIPTKILHSYYRDSVEDKLCVERCLLSCIIPVNLPDAERMERMVHVYNSLSDDHAVKAFDALLVSRHRVRVCLHELVQLHQDSSLEGDDKKQAILSATIQLSRYLPDSLKCRAYLKFLVESLGEDEKLKENLLTSIDTSCSCAEVLKAKVDVVSKVSSKAMVLETVRNLLDRACPMLIDAKCVELLVVKVCSELYEPQSGEEGEEEEEEGFDRAKKAVHLIKVLAGIMPANFSSPEVFERLTSLLKHEDREIVKSVLQILTQAGQYIDQSVSSCLQSILMQLALSGEPELAKDTVRCMDKSFKDPKPIMGRLFASLLNHLDYDDDNLPTVLISLAQVAQLQPQVFTPKHKLIIKEFVVRKLITEDKAENEFIEGAREWVPDDAVSYETKMKVLSIKLLVNWLLGLSRIGSAAEMEKSASSVIRLLGTILEHDGDLNAQDNISAHDRSRLRLASACAFLKLAKSSAYRDTIPLPVFQKLALTVQDSCEEVRERFVEKLNKGLLSLKLPLEYMGILVYAGTEPSKANHSKFHKMISASVTKRRQYLSQSAKAKEQPHLVLPEYSVSMAVHLVAHHPDFSRTDSHKLDKFKECLWFFLEPIVIRGENYGFLKKLLESIKLTVDAQSPTNSEANKNLFASCDLAMGVMASKLTHIKLDDFSGEVTLPAKLFQVKEKSAQNSIRYLPPEYNCTPTKRLKADPVVSPPTGGEAETKATTNAKSPNEPIKKATAIRKTGKTGAKAKSSAKPKAAAKSTAAAPKAKASAPNKTSPPKAPAPAPKAKASATKKAPPSKEAKGEATRATRSRKRQEKEANVQKDSGVSDIECEEQAQEEEEDEVPEKKRPKLDEDSPAAEVQASLETSKIKRKTRRRR